VADLQVGAFVNLNTTALFTSLDLVATRRLCKIGKRVAECSYYPAIG
jgi:hypothetical protein